MKLIDDSIWRLHSIRVAIGSAVIWSATGGLIMVWPVLADRIPTAFYIVGGVLLSAAFGVARVLKQPGAQ